MQGSIDETGSLLSEDHAPRASWGRTRVFGAIGLSSLAVACVSVSHWSPAWAKFKFADTRAFMQAQYQPGYQAGCGDQVPAPVAPVAPVEPAAPVECSWEGENCLQTQCCKRVGMTCWEKMPNVWGGCSSSCEELTKFGGDWTCAGLGPAKTPKALLPVAAAPPAVTLFCFMVITPQGICPPGVKEGYEQQLVDAIRTAKASVFACDASNIFEGKRSTEGEWKSIKNTEVFAQVWRQVQADGKYLQHDWTVKVDADAVFIPDRLKMHIASMKPPPGEPVYLHNIDFKFHFMGALEVMTKAAADKLIQNIDLCLQHIGSNGGEDIFTMECLDAIDVGYMEDDSLLDDKYSSPEHFNLFDVDRCHNDAIVAFHPYKAVNSWMGCLKVANGEVKTTQFTSCVHRWEGEACSLSGTLDHPGKVDPGTGIVG